ncbi:MAG: FadR/GntR family transcriptional regulator [Pseudomonadota bacterium]
MPFTRIQSDKLADAVATQIERLVLRGVLRPGDRLPSERDLSERLGVSRPVLREAIAAMQETGLVEARANSGIYIGDVLGSAFSPAIMRLFATVDEAKFDYLDFRSDLEGLAAERAARFGSDTDLAVIAEIFARMEAASGKRKAAQEEAALDAEFHLAIIEASHNVIMLHMMRSMFELLHQGIFYNRQIMFGQKTTRSAILGQHAKINTAIQARDGAAARKAVEAHLAYVRDSLRDHMRAKAHEDVAKQRLHHLRTKK